MENKTQTKNKTDSLTYHRKDDVRFCCTVFFSFRV